MASLRHRPSARQCLSATSISCQDKPLLTNRSGELRMDCDRARETIHSLARSRHSPLRDTIFSEMRAVQNPAVPLPGPDLLQSLAEKLFGDARYILLSDGGSSELSPRVAQSMCFLSAPAYPFPFSCKNQMCTSIPF